VLSVLIPTRNGAQRSLPATLEAFCRLHPPEDGWKLIVIDNASTDGTRSLVEARRDALPIEYVYEPRVGKNRALNTGLEHAVGDLVVFTDDDVLPVPEWLPILRRAADARPPYSIFGGPVLPRWPSQPPSWILDWVPLSPTYTVLYPRPEGPYLARGVFGPNMAIRAEVFQKGYRFDERIGPRGRSYAMGSETELLLRLEQAGYLTWHCQRALLFHAIETHQMTEDWILERALRFGRGMYRLQTTTGQRPQFSAMGSRRSLGGELVRRWIKVQQAHRAGDPEAKFKHRWYLRFHTGRALEAARVFRDRWSRGARVGQ
jgi:glycosyltransferase involved in cell wall biosynthesis